MILFCPVSEWLDLRHILQNRRSRRVPFGLPPTEPFLCHHISNHFNGALNSLLLGLEVCEELTLSAWPTAFRVGINLLPIRRFPFPQDVLFDGKELGHDCSKPLRRFGPFGADRSCFGGFWRLHVGPVPSCHIPGRLRLQMGWISQVYRRPNLLSPQNQKQRIVMAPTQDESGNHRARGHCSDEAYA
jgi:hypothetical protein